MKTGLCLLLHFFIVFFAHAEGNKCVFKGYVYDFQTKKPIPNVSVKVINNNTGTVTDAKGSFSILMNCQENKVHFSHVSYKEVTYQIGIYQEDTLHSIWLEPKTITTEEISVTDQSFQKNIPTVSPNHVVIQAKNVEQLPQLLGETDAIKTMQYFSGVQSVSENSSGYYVRGGGADQNLILFDNATLYNPNHLFGFFSIFNSDIIQSVELIKGGFPARFGGRLSSVMKIKSVQAIPLAPSVKLKTGFLSTKATIRIPIQKNSAFYISGRRTYFDYLFKAYNKLTNNNEQYAYYYFYDLNIGFSFKPSNRDIVTLSAFNIKDDMDYFGKNDFQNSIYWKTHTTQCIWKHTYSKSFFQSMSLYYTNYTQGFNASLNKYALDLSSELKDINFRADWSILQKRHRLNFGIEIHKYFVQPNSIKANTGNMNLDFGRKTGLYSYESSLYLEDEFKIWQNFAIHTGLRFNVFTQTGPFIRYNNIYDGYKADTMKYDKNRIIHSYYQFEPRLSIKYLLQEKSDLNFSYSLTNQNLHLVPLTSLSLPTDIWVSSTSIIKPQKSQLFSIGYQQNSLLNIFNLTVELYYKQMKNQIEYKEGVFKGYNLQDNFDSQFIFGKGESKGIEAMIAKPSGKLSGWVSYTYSRTRQRFPYLNSGDVFPAKYDRPHDLSCVAKFTINPRIDLSAVFVYASGNVITLPTNRYIIRENIVNEYSVRNSSRLPPYHRLDMSVNYHVSKKKCTYSWNFSIFNIYNRLNPYYIFFQSEGNINENKISTSIQQVSIFPIMPSVSFQISL